MTFNTTSGIEDKKKLFWFDRMCPCLEPWVCFGEGSEKLCHAFPVPSQNAILNVL